MHVTLLNKVPIENIALAHGIDPVSAIDISAAISAAEMLQPTQTREQRPIFRAALSTTASGIRRRVQKLFIKMYPEADAADRPNYNNLRNLAMLSDGQVVIANIRHRNTLRDHFRYCLPDISSGQAISQ